MLFIDARHIFRQIDRAHRDWLPEQIEFLANIVRLYRGEKRRDRRRVGGADGRDRSPTASTSTCRACARWRRSSEIEAQGWSLNPGRYVGVAAAEDDGVDFGERLEELNEELEKLNAEARAAGADRGERGGVAGVTA